MHDPPPFFGVWYVCMVCMYACMCAERRYLSGIDEDTIIGSISHEVGVAYVVLDDSTAKDDHSGLLGIHRLVVQRANICRQTYAPERLGPRMGERQGNRTLNDIHDEALVLIGMEIDHIPYRAVRQGGTEHGNIVLYHNKKKKEQRTAQERKGKKTIALQRALAQVRVPSNTNSRRTWGC